MHQPPLGCPHVRKNEKIDKRRVRRTVHLRPPITVRIIWPGRPNLASRFRIPVPPPPHVRAFRGSSPVRHPIHQTLQMNQHLNLSLPSPPSPRNAPKRTTPPLQHSSTPARFLAPRRPTQTQSSTNSEQFRPNDTSEIFFLLKTPQN